MDWRLGPAYGLAASLARAGDSPRVCLVGTALGDAGDICRLWPGRVARQPSGAIPRAERRRRPRASAGSGCRVGSRRQRGEPPSLVAAARIGQAMHAAWQAGVVLMGVSAGSVCWFAGGTTDAFGLPLRPVTDALGFLPCSNSPHHDAEEQRRPTIHRLIGEGILPDGYASDNGTGLIFEGTDLVDCVTEVEGSRTWQMTRRRDRTVKRFPCRLGCCHLDQRRPDWMNAVSAEAAAALRSSISVRRQPPARRVPRRNRTADIACRMSASPPPSVTAAECGQCPNGAATVSIPAPG